MAVVSLHVFIISKAILLNVNLKGCPFICQAGTKGIYMYSSTPNRSRGYNGVGGQRRTPAALPPEKGSRTHFTEGWLGLGPFWFE